MNKVTTSDSSRPQPSFSSQQSSESLPFNNRNSQYSYHAAAAFLNPERNYVVQIGCMAQTNEEAHHDAMNTICQLINMMQDEGIYLADLKDKNFRAFFFHQCELRSDHTAEGQSRQPIPAYPAVYAEYQEALRHISRKRSISFEDGMHVISNSQIPLLWTASDEILIKQERGQICVYLNDRRIYPQTTD